MIPFISIILPTQLIKQTSRVLNLLKLLLILLLCIILNTNHIVISVLKSLLAYQSPHVQSQDTLRCISSVYDEFSFFVSLVFTTSLISLYRSIFKVLYLACNRKGLLNTIPT